jgi:hypothetical protein
MDQPTEGAMEPASSAYESSAYEALAPAALSPLDPQDALDLHRAINERRAQVENPELLRRLRAL